MYFGTEVPRSATVRTALLLSLLLPFTAAAQGYGPLTAHLAAFGDAGSDAQRDSINALVKSDLTAILTSDTAFTAGFRNVPISHVQPADGAFRLFTWNFRRADGSFHYEGRLLVAGKKGPELIALRDFTQGIPDPARVQLTPEKWYGALYYAVVPVKRGAKTLYTLLGWKGVSDIETRKVIEVLSFSPVPKFGAPVFPDGPRTTMRKNFAYSAKGKMTLNWDAAHLSIVADHLAPTDPAFEGNPAFMAPDMTYDAYVWEKGQWEMQRDVDVRGTKKDTPFKAPKP